MKKAPHAHWEVDSICPHCGQVNHIHVPVGQHVVRVHCSHCPHGYEYNHIVQEYEYVQDETEGS